ncbi:MAG: DNA mismatch repair protein MutT, partial [Anaerolineae bacterium]|nr:DNA mismatch repair protein MutT [Anaerolineae bacterium]
MAILRAERNVFDGYTIDPDALPDDAEAFVNILSHSLRVWREEGGKLVWLEIPAVKSALIPVAIQLGFRFHHTNDDSLMLTLPLGPNAFIPKYATHYIGAGGVVFNDAHELLVICEKAHSRHRPHYYKLPGGALLP